ncbi:MAG: hypothetical protein O6761_06960 [Thaumarchaeota archaeon]|nr:hypothetical protein [Nitrososphaerota archaeon]
MPRKDLSAVGTALVKAGMSTEFAQGFDAILTGDDLEFMLDELLFEDEPDLVEDFLGQPIDTFDKQNIDDLISELQEHPLVKTIETKNRQNQVLEQMKPGKLDQKQRIKKFKELKKLSQEQEKNLEGTNLLLIYRTKQDGRVDDLICLPDEGEVYRMNDPNRPVIPRDRHPGCRCEWEDALTGELLGQF